MDFQSDPEAANARLLEELKHLRLARHALRDSQEAAFLAVARYEARLDKIEKRLFNDPLTKLRNRIGLETTLEVWWQEGRHRSRPMSAVLWDLDDFGLVNELHGPLIAERILHQVAQQVHRRLGEADLAARYSGQRLFAAMVDVGPRVATRNAEMIRQAIQRITFLHGEEKIRVTVRGGITEVKPDDTPPALFKRIEEALAAAKRAGPNGAFFHDGRKAEPVQSPNLGAEPVEIDVS
jgi:diguanylate cyclase